MRYVTVALLLFAAVTAHAQNVDRYWGEFEIARVRLTAWPVDGGAGRGLYTGWVPIFAQAVIRVEEAQNFTWEWIGLTSPGDMALDGFPNLTFDASSDDTFEFTELKMDLNPIEPNIWGSAEEYKLPIPELTVAGTYSSFSTTTDFEATYELWLEHLSTPRDASFSTVVSRVDFRRFPMELAATVRSRSFDSSTQLRMAFGLDDVIELEPRLALGPVQIHQFRESHGDCDQLDMIYCNNRDRITFDLTHTPSGDANNDGKVSFDDFLILSGNFQVAEAARWDDGDFDEDGDVDFSDFLSLSTNFNSGVAAVPEPSAGVLAMLTVGGLRACRRRR